MRIKYTLHVFNLDSNLEVDVIQTKSITELDVINKASRIVDTAKTKRKSLEVVIKGTLSEKRIGKVTPDDIILD